MSQSHQTLRMARPSNKSQEIIRFYVNGLGFEILSKFENHDGFDGLIIGARHAPYHFEFTHDRNHQHETRAPSVEHLIVFYFESEEEWRATSERLKNLGFSPVKSHNPYWDKKGESFEDPDGYRIVLNKNDWRL